MTLEVLILTWCRVSAWQERIECVAVIMAREAVPPCKFFQRGGLVLFFFVGSAMWCPVALLLPDECQQVLRALRACKVCHWFHTW